MFLAACQSSPHAEPGQGADPKAVIRNEGYALLYSTIDEDADVDKVLIIKGPSPQVAELIKAIGEFCRSARSTLQALSKEDPAIALDKQGLPEAETKTRAAISSTTSRQILFSGGKELEFRLLLTQHEALNYITHLAGELEKQEPRDNRKRYLGQLVKQSTDLHERVLAQLKAPYVGPAR
jgi:hypothetical protein